MANYTTSMAALSLESSVETTSLEGRRSISSLHTDEPSSERELLARRRYSSSSIRTFQTAQTTSTLRTLTGGLKTLRQAALGPLIFIPVLSRVAAAKRELATIRQKSLPSPLFEQRKVLDELLVLSDDSNPRHIRKSALRILRRSFYELIHDVFLPFGQEVYECYKLALDDLSNESLASNIRNEDFHGYYYMVAAGANLQFKDAELEKEDCRMISTIARSSSLPTLKLAGYVYIRISWQHHSKKDVNPVTKELLKEAAEAMMSLSSSLYRHSVRQSAIDQLWFLENASQGKSGLTTPTNIRAVLALIMDLSLDPKAPDNGLSALSRVWWFMSFEEWADEVSKDSSFKHRVGEILLKYSASTCNEGTRRQTFQLLYRLSNLPSWGDALELNTLQEISMSFAKFCLTEQQSDVAKRTSVVREIRKVVNEAPEKSPLMMREVATITKRLDVEVKAKTGGISERIASWLCIDDQLRNWESQSPSIDTHSMIENLSVFVLPDESLLDKHNFDSVLERVSTYAQTISQTREIAVDALFVLINVRNWLKALPIQFDGTIVTTVTNARSCSG